MRVAAALLVAGLGVVASGSAARAAGPLVVNGAGAPLVYDTSVPIPYNPDRGKLGALDNASALAEVAASFAVWAAVPTTTVTFANAGLMPVDVTADNVLDYFNKCDGLSPVVFDRDGSIMDALVGGGSFVLGIALPECGEFDPPVITESFTVLNGRFLDGIDQGFANPEMPLADFRAVFVHEFGHFINLDHSQLNIVEAFDGDPGNDDAIATMFPIAVSGAEGATLHLDDAVSVSRLYPAPSFASAFGRITGSIFQYDLVTPFQGAYVIARKTDDPRVTAVAAASGDRYFPSQPGGGPPPASLENLYELPGLPPGDYTVEIEQIDPRFQGGSGVGPLSPPAFIPGPAEFWNGTDEAGDDPPDDPAASVPITVAAGATVSDVDVVINRPGPPPNDDCANATVFTPLRQNEVVITTEATTEPTDPVQLCTKGGAHVNHASVWYRFTPPTDGIFQVITREFGGPYAGSPYDTVVSIMRGTCGSVVPLACNDDFGASEPKQQSAVSADVTAGESYLAEITAHHTVAPEDRLHVDLRFTPDSPICADPEQLFGYNLVISKLGPPHGDERLKLDVDVVAPYPIVPMPDPSANGLQLFIEDEVAEWTPYYGLTGVTAVPPGGPGSGCGPQDGWRKSGPDFKYRNTSGALPGGGCAPGSANGLQRISVRDLRLRKSSVRVSLRAKELHLPMPAQDPGVPIAFLRTAVTFSATTNDPCGQATLVCEVLPSGHTLRCRL